MPEDYFREVYGKTLVSRLTSLIERQRERARKREGREVLEVLQYLIRRIDEESDKCDLSFALTSAGHAFVKFQRWIELEEPWPMDIELLRTNLEDFLRYVAEKFVRYCGCKRPEE